MKKIALVTLVAVVLSFTTSAAFAWGWWNNVSIYNTDEEEYTDDTINNGCAINVSVYNTD